MSFVDPSPSLDHGFAVWTRADGSSALAVVPGNSNTSFEAWRPVLEDNPEIGAGTYVPAWRRGHWGHH
jgi:hypothetical protein